ncbi:MAG: hypothetical protein U9R40_05535 [Synergistota bacterium]|nr:hypothetical protein [Synergistota bacterium]
MADSRWRMAEKPVEPVNGKGKKTMADGGWRKTKVPMADGGWRKTEKACHCDDHREE